MFISLCGLLDCETGRGIRADIASGKGGVKVRKELMAKMDDLRDKSQRASSGGLKR